MNFFNLFKSNKSVFDNSPNLFWCDCNCNCSELFPPFDYNSLVCSNCIGVKDHNKKNFGDMITFYIFKKVTGKIPIRFNDKLLNEPVFFGSGSMMNLCNGSKNAIIWGTGIIHSKDIFEKPKQVLAVRGPLTRKRFLELGYDCPEVYGDIGLLLPNFYDKKMSVNYEIGIIPHYVDYEFCKKQFSNLDCVLVIDVCEDVETVIDNIRKCKRTISSSLHGLIISHAYGIKSAWIKFSNYIYGDDVKFLDYYYSQNLINVNDSIKIDRSYLTNIQYLVNQIEKYPNPKFPINTSKLLKMCPF